MKLKLIYEQFSTGVFESKKMPWEDLRQFKNKKAEAIFIDSAGYTGEFGKMIDGSTEIKTKFFQNQAVFYFKAGRIRINSNETTYILFKKSKSDMSIMFRLKNNSTISVIYNL